MKHFLLLVIIAAAVALGASPVRLTVITGGHDHETSFYTLFDQPDFKVRIDGHPSAYRGDLRTKADVVVLYDSPRTEAEAPGRPRLQEFAEAGKGIVVLHHALCSHGDWPWYTETLAGARYRFTAPASSYSHDENITVTKAVAASHPVLEGLPATFTLTDETYQNMWMAPSNQVLLRTDHPKSDGPVAWISAYPKSRVVVIQLGHDHTAHNDANFRRLMHNAIRWAAAK